MLFPDPSPVAKRPCARCHHPVAPDRLVDGKYGTDCAALLGLTTTTPRMRTHDQTGVDLLDLLDPDREPEDHCDG